jgi:hypothetical protein
MPLQVGPLRMAKTCAKRPLLHPHSRRRTYSGLVRQRQQTGSNRPSEEPKEARGNRDGS